MVLFQQQAIFGPFLAMILLTVVVWVVMYFHRIRYIRANKFKPDELTKAALTTNAPPHVRNPSDNFQNLFEMPVLFYGLCVYLYVTNQVDLHYVIAGWVFWGFRVLHSAMHCALNIVMVRFYFYLASCIALFYILFRAVGAHFF